MARGYIYTCKCCGKEYEYCPKCAVRKPTYDAERYCSKDHADIFAILSKHGCNLISADEALAALSAYNLDNVVLTKNILTHIEKIKSEAGLKAKESTPSIKEKVVSEKNGRTTVK